MVGYSSRQFAHQSLIEEDSCAETPQNANTAEHSTWQGIMEIIDTIKEQIESNPILLYMKGSPNQPQCGFSAKTVQSLMVCGERFAYVDILSNPDIRENLPQYANWPSLPQLWLYGELIGGCDIACELFKSGELQTKLSKLDLTQ